MVSTTYEYENGGFKSSLNLQELFMQMEDLYAED